MELWLRQRRIDSPTTPLVMGVLNVTPDSFSDGGDYVAPEDAVARAVEMITEGADIIDVGPESTRPNAAEIPAAEQIARAIPVIEAIRAKNDQIVISIDTTLAPVAKAALEAGADMVNDVSALRDDSDMVELVAEARAPVVLMHRRGCPPFWSPPWGGTAGEAGGGPEYDDVVSEIADFLKERQHFAVTGGIDPSRIIFDPGIGFGKRVEHNLMILRHLDRFIALGPPVMVGASRKSFIGNVLDIAEPKQRASGSLACVVIAIMAGIAMVRVHDVRQTVEAVRLCQAVRVVRPGSPAMLPD